MKVCLGITNDIGGDFNGRAAFRVIGDCTGIAEGDTLAPVMTGEERDSGTGVCTFFVIFGIRDVGEGISDLILAGIETGEALNFLEFKPEIGSSSLFTVFCKVKASKRAKSPSWTA